MPDVPTIEPAILRQRLLDEQASLRSSSEAHEDDRRPVTLDQQSVGRLSRMDALQGQAMAVATEERRQVRLQQIEAALARLEQDAFGDCVACGEPIDPRRLGLDPAVPTCLECAARAR